MKPITIPQLIDCMDTQQFSLYLHIPFCKTMCTYCAFNTYVDLDDLIPAFVQALAREIRIVATANPEMSLKSIFFGGGTPSLITPQQYRVLFQAIRESFVLAPDCEISLESNPNDLTEAYLSQLRAIGFNRISIGMQSANPDVLTLFNRRHDMAMTRAAVSAARAADFDNISLDLIFASPHETLATWRATLREAIALEPHHISHYELILKGGTELTERVKTGDLPAIDDDLAADMYELATEMLQRVGYRQYEISNWSRDGYQSQHNLQYWRNLPYLGLGPGAHGFADGVRYIVTRSPQKYIDSLQTVASDYAFPRTPAVSKATVVDRKTDMSETIMMGLRLTQEGIDREAFRQRFGADIVDLYRTTIETFVGYGLLHVDDERIRVTEAGRLLNNAIIRELI